MPKALVTAAMPVLNAAATVEAALRDLQAQSVADIEIVVCDNASQDETASIVERISEADPRVRLLKFKERVDIRGSFKRAYEAVETPYFMFTPADDRWYPNFVERNLAVLEERDDLIASTGRVAFFEEGKFSHISTGTQSLLGEPGERLLTYLRDPGENARAFSLMRTASMKGAFPEKTFPGWDFLMTARTLLKGGYFELDDVLAERDVTPIEGYIRQAEAHYGDRFRSSVPLGRYAFEVSRDRQLSGIRGRRRAVAAFAWRSHIIYAQYRMPRWYSLLEKINRTFSADQLPVAKDGMWSRL